MKTEKHSKLATTNLLLIGLASIAACQGELQVDCPPGLSDVCYSHNGLGDPTIGVAGCRVGVRLCFEHQGKIVERCEGEVIPVAEICDQQDNDCSGSSDEGGACNAKITEELERNLDDLESRTGPLWAFTRPGRSGPTLLTREHWSPIFQCAETTTPRECTDAFINAEAAALGIGSVEDELEFEREIWSGANTDSTAFVRYRQIHGENIVQSGGVLIRVRDHKVMSAEVFNVPVLPGAATTPAVSEAKVVNGLPKGSTIVSGPVLNYVPDDPALPLEEQTHLLAYVVVYQRAEGEVYERVVDATTGSVLRDVSQRSDDLVLTVDGANTPPAAGTPQSRVWNKVTDTYNFVNAMPVDFASGNPITLVENPATSPTDFTNTDEFNANIVGPILCSNDSLGQCDPATCADDPNAFCPTVGFSFWYTRDLNIVVGTITSMGETIPLDYTTTLVTDHEAYHLVYGPYMNSSYDVATEEAIDHAFVDIGSLLVECSRQLAASADNCSWLTGYTGTSSIEAFRTGGYSASVPITTGMGGNWADICPASGCNRTDNKFLFGAPIVRTLIRWGLTEENIRRMQYLMDATAYRLPNHRISGMAISEFARFMINTCQAASDDELWGLTPERCTDLQLMFDTANITSYCELFSDQEYCNGHDDNCDGYIDNCLTADECCGWQHLSAFFCDEDDERRQDYSLTSWCYGGPAEPGEVLLGVCRAGFRTCAPAGVNSASWSDACNGEVAPSQEVCSLPARDEDCDGEANEDEVRVPCVYDADNDGVQGNGPVSMRCSCTGRWYAQSEISDCNDSNATIFPRGVGFIEGTSSGLCNLVDDDCDGSIDDGCPCTPATSLPRPCGPPSDLGPLCTYGVQRCMLDPATGSTRWTTECSGDEWGGPEICDGFDNDCDGLADNDDPEGMLYINPPVACFDDDYEPPCPGHFVCTSGRYDCVGDARPEACNGRDDDCDGIADDGLSGNPENCDGEDNNCNSAIDEGLARDCSNICGIGTETCIDGSWARCTAPDLPPTVADPRVEFYKDQDFAGLSGTQRAGDAPICHMDDLVPGLHDEITSLRVYLNPGSYVEVRDDYCWQPGDHICFIYGSGEVVTITNLNDYDIPSGSLPGGGSFECTTGQLSGLHDDLDFSQITIGPLRCD